MQLLLDDTIAALASAPGPAARGIIRLSGPAAIGCIESTFKPDDLAAWQSAGAAAIHRGSMHLRDVHAPLPVVVCRWPAGRSYTSQLLLEIHTAGSPPLLEAILASLFERGVRPATAGEFTLRAFLSGRIDLVQAEAVNGVIDAADPARLAAALRQLAGGISGRVAGIRDDLIDLLADLEAGLDFVDENLEFVTRDDLRRRLVGATSGIADLLRQCDTRTQSTGRRRVVLAGLPNAGKSTLFNALLRREAALVSTLPGTTRDYLRADVEWHGMALELLDTPGWETPANGLPAGETSHTAVLRDAQRLSREQWAEADLILWCSPADQADAAREVESGVKRTLTSANRPFLNVRTKVDLSIDGATTRGAHVVEVSALTGVGFPQLIGACVNQLSVPADSPAGLLATTAARCRESLVHAAANLAAASAAVEEGAGEEIVALEVRESLEHLGRVLGAVYTDDILDRVFSRFCIGK